VRLAKGRSCLLSGAFLGSGSRTSLLPSETEKENGNMKLSTEPDMVNCEKIVVACKELAQCGIWN
jgi:hypothetical protein